MKNLRKINIHYLLAIVCALLFTQVNAQQVTNEEVQYSSTSDYSTIDLQIPENTTYDGLVIWCKGGDGGRSKLHDGGGGAKANVVFKIGEQDNQIPAGSTIRLIVGHKGAQYDKTGWGGMGAGAGGGAGSAVLLLPKGSSNWNKSKILAVAGGGGGAGKHGTGQSGNDSEEGTAGHDNYGNGLGNGGTSYSPAGGTTDLSNGGASAFKDAIGTTDESICIDRDPLSHKGYPSGGAGSQCYNYGGWGFGGGGSGNTAGGGGGGFCGGGGGGDGGEVDGEDGTGGGGGGGGSYISPDFQMSNHEITTGGSTSSPSNGHITVFLTKYSSVPTGIASIKLASNEGYCVNNSNGDTSPGNKIGLFRCKDNDKQHWYFDESKIKLDVARDRCIILEKGNTQNGNSVYLHICTNKAESNWVYDVDTGQFRSKVDLDKCISSNGFGEALTIQDCDSSDDSQQFVVE